MMGFGPYGNNGGPYTSPSSSNLSASAPPFTIDRSPSTGYMPLVDLLEQSSKTGPLNNSSSLHNWLPPRSPTSEPNFFSNTNLELNSVASSPNNPYNYASSNTHLPHLSTTVSASADAFTYAQSGDSGAKPYYPSYFSPSAQKDGPLVIPDQSGYDWLSSSSRVASVALDGSSNKDYSQRSADSEYPAQWGGSWNGFSEWKQGKPGLFDGSFCCSKETDIPVSSMYENYMNQETHIPKGLNRAKEAFHGVKNLDSEKHGSPMNAEKFNDKSFSGTSNFQTVDYSRSFLGSLSGLSDSSLGSPSFMIGSSFGSHQIPYVVSNEKQLKLHANDSFAIAKSSPTLVIGPPAAGSAPNSALLKSVNLGSVKTDTDLICKKASSFMHSDGVKHAFDPTQLSIHLEIDDPTSLGSFVTKNEEMSNKDTGNTLHHSLKSKSGPQVSNVTHDVFNLDLNTNEDINSVEGSFESADHYNPAVDSPCWKGVPASRSSPFDASIPETKKQEVFTDPNVQAKQIFELDTGDKVSSQKPNENSRYHEFGSPENVLEFPLSSPQVTNSKFGDQKSDDIIKIGCDSEAKGVQHYDAIHEHGSWSIGCSDFKSSLNAEQNIQGNGLTSENINKVMKYVSPSPVEHFIPSSVDDASMKLNKSNEGPLTPTIDAPMLVGTIRNLSELLLFHCTSGSCQLRQKHLEIIQNVIDNLSVCASENSEKKVSRPELTSSEKDTSDHIGEPQKLQKNVALDKPQVAETAGLIHNLLDDQNVHKRNKHYMAGKENDEMLDSISVRADLDTVDEDKATQALKKVLTENFHDKEETQPHALLYKNLWLEAEAALCSISYKARFNRMKMEMEKLKSPEFKDAHANTDMTEMKNGSRSEFSPDPNVFNTLSPRAEDCPTTKSQESSVFNTHIDNDDVMARFQILRCRAEKANHGIVVNMDKPSSPKVSPHSDKVGKILLDAQEGNGIPKPGIPTQASSNVSTEHPSNGYEAAVMARFHILKSRADNYSPRSTEAQLAETIDGSSVGSRSEVGSSYISPELVLQHSGADSTEGQITGSEFHMYVDNYPVSQSHRSNRCENSLLAGSNRRENSLLAGWFDRVSSEWEHVGKEELGLQNR